MSSRQLVVLAVSTAFASFVNTSHSKQEKMSRSMIRQTAPFVGETWQKGIWQRIVSEEIARSEFVATKSSDRNALVGITQTVLEKGSKDNRAELAKMLVSKVVMQENKPHSKMRMKLEAMFKSLKRSPEALDFLLRLALQADETTGTRFDSFEEGKNRVSYNEYVELGASWMRAMAIEKIEDFLSEMNQEELSEYEATVIAVENYFWQRLHAKTPFYYDLGEGSSRSVGATMRKARTAYEHAGKLLGPDVEVCSYPELVEAPIDQNSWVVEKLLSSASALEEQASSLRREAARLCLTKGKETEGEARFPSKFSVSNTIDRINQVVWDLGRVKRAKTQPGK